MTPSARPLSPHLQVYRFQLTMALSIIHRITGVGLSLGSVLLVALLLSLAAGPEAYRVVHDFCASWFGMLLLFGWSWALCYHMCNGIRHLAWDIGWGFEIPRVYLSGWLAVGASLLLTALIWGCVLARGGAA